MESSGGLMLPSLLRPGTGGGGRGERERDGFKLNIRGKTIYTHIYK